VTYLIKSERKHVNL